LSLNLKYVQLRHKFIAWRMSSTESFVLLYNVESASRSCFCVLEGLLYWNTGEKAFGVKWHENFSWFDFNFLITIDQEVIENVGQFKYLGVWLTDNKNFDKHYQDACQKMTSRLYMLNRNKKCFSPRWKHIFATSLVISVLDYCLPVWGNLTDTKASRINRILLRTAKLVVAPKSYGKLSKINAVEQLNWLLCQERMQVYTVD